MKTTLKFTIKSANELGTFSLQRQNEITVRFCYKKIQKSIV